jgi:hypothetical protein
MAVTHRWSSSSHLRALTFTHRQKLRAEVSAALLKRQFSHLQCSCCGRVLPRAEFHMRASLLCATCRDREREGGAE